MIILLRPTAMGFSLILVVAHLALPLASSFAAAGSHASLPTPSASLPTTATSQQEHVPGRRLTGRHMSNTGADGTSGSSSSSPSSTIRQFLSRVKQGRRHSQTASTTLRAAGVSTPAATLNRPWKGGETTASIPSKLIFNYASKLMRTATQRPLDVEDAFDVPESRRMDQAVMGLARIHEKKQLQSQQRQIELQREASSSSDTDSAATRRDKEISAQSILLAKSLLLHQRKTLILTGCLRLANTAIQAFPALLVARILRFVEAGNAYPASRALQAALTLVGVLSVKMILENQYFHNVVKCSTSVRGSLAGLLFDKSLRLPAGGSSVTNQKVTTSKTGNNSSSNSNSTTTAAAAAAPNKEQALGVGGVLNLMQSDASIIESAALQFHTLWDGPLQIAMYTTLLFRYLGPSVLWGIAVLLMTIPINSITLRVLNRLSKFENEAKDARTKRTAEAVSNMKLLKLQGWEQRFAEDIRKDRRDELRWHVARGVVRALNSAISNAVPALVLVVTLTAYVRTGRPIVASTIFTAISLFNQLRFPLFFYPMLIDSLANGRNAMRRIASYLSAEEMVNYVQTLPPMENGGGSIEMKNGNFLWSSVPSVTEDKKESAKPALVDVDFKVNPGEVVAVVGSVGSGKSALIKGLLGELSPVPRTMVSSSKDDDADELDDDKGLPDIPIMASVIQRGNVAYCSQEAWLPKGTIKDAIVFGREYDERRYVSAIRDAGLDRDIVDVSVGDTASGGMLSHDTDVGEGGSSLSGGQRARVALARALYAGEDTKIFLLDDCLAALDASVGSTVFERLTAKLRKAGAATLLVTNDQSIPRRCDKVVIMGKSDSSPSCSTIVDFGTYDELVLRGHNLSSISAVAKQNHVKNESINDRPNDASPQETQTKSKAVVEPPKLMQIGTASIRVVGGYEAPQNSTCHADPESQALMEVCADSLDGALSENSNVKDLDDVLTGADSVSAHTKRKLGQATSRGDDGILEDEVFISAPEMQIPNKATKIFSADDSMSTGAVPLATYLSYFKAVRKPVLVVAMLASYLLANGAQFFQQYTVAKWTQAGKDGAIAASMSAKYLNSLVNAAGVVSVFLWLRSFLIMQVGVRASEFMHSRMLKSVFEAPMSFFDATPSGQLLSRFGKEMETVDRGVPDSIGAVLFCFLQIFLSIGALAGIVTPAMLVPLGAVTILYLKAMSIFRPAARYMKRAETKTRSPIYTHFGEALRGTDTIRSIPGARSTWSRTHRDLFDRNLRVFYTVKAFDRWLSTRLETLGNTVVFTAAVASVFLTRSGKLQAGSAGWGLTQALSITGLLTWAVRCLTDLETNMMSVSRVKELTDIDSEKGSRTMPKEASKAGEALVPLLPNPTLFSATVSPIDSSALVSDGWPWRGNIQFSNVSMRYNPAAPLILNGVTLTVPAGSTLGVVGRTGSGKSSLLLTLFRLVEIEGNGRIEIDGVDIRSVDLETLRRSLAIIPQDPVLFAGSVAYNLDATGESNPEDMWNALQAASPTLAAQFRNGDGLETAVTEGGKNLSLGQRQLICLARALLRKSKILVLDEATSSVDQNTDQEVQETIRREFVEKGVTVITVAHRLDTVLGYDKIAVLGAGNVIEYGTPADLLSIEGGELRRLVNADRLNKQKGALQQDDSMIPA